MAISSNLFEAFLKCPTKCWLRAANEPASGNAYAEWVRSQTESYHETESKRLLSVMPTDEVVLSPPMDNLKTAKWRLAASVVVEAQTNSCVLESEIHTVERRSSEEPGKPIQFIPIRFTFTNKVVKDDKLLLAFDAFVLSKMLGSEITVGKIIHGDDHATHNVRISALASEVRKCIDKISALLSSPSPPDLVLNRHCAECEFQGRCRQKAVEKDDLSLLAAMSGKERDRHRSKGIFTVNQLSYTFRPRRTPKRAKKPAKPRYPALQALAIREKTVYIRGSPILPRAKTQIYLDIEGLPDGEFYYLLGALFVTDEKETFLSLWADQEPDELQIFTDFLEAVCQLPDFHILHFGNYETVALKRMKAKLPECLHPKIDLILRHATNALSVIHPHIYFPTYSNGLKDIGHYLGFERKHESATGLQATVWRKIWETTKNADLKASLVQYNQDDCRELKYVCELIAQIIGPNPARPQDTQAIPKAARADEMVEELPHWELFRPRTYASEDFKHITKCAYFDYQREKVLARTHRQFTTINKRHRKHRQTTTRPNQIVDIECSRCPRCKKRSVDRTKKLSRLFIDLKFSKSGVKRWITRINSYRYKCQKCLHQFGSEARNAGMPYRYGRGFMSWCVYMSFFCDMKMSRTRIAMGDTFEIFVDDSRMMRARHQMTAEYEGLYAAILGGLLQEKVLHVDETSVKLVGSKGYVWVIAGMDKVYYFYKPSREGSFLQEMLQPFSGVLVSDFYAAYDSLDCKQQKCIVHFVRDIDDDLLKNPLDAELKSIAHEFGSLLRTIVQTVDRYGLKRRHLGRHKPAVLQFLDSVASKEFSSELARAYKKRFQKSGAKMFSFLDHDGVPWNNTNAEHAIKRFAKFRAHV